MSARNDGPITIADVVVICSMGIMKNRNLLMTLSFPGTALISETTVPCLYGNVNKPTVYTKTVNTGNNEYSESVNALLRDAEKDAQYEEGMLCLYNGDYKGAIEIFSSLGNYRDSKKMLIAARDAKSADDYENAMELLSKGDYNGAIRAFTLLGDYQDSAKKLAEAQAAKKKAENNK